VAGSRKPQIKQGHCHDEPTSIFEIFPTVVSGTRLPNVLPRGYLRGIAFAPDGLSFYYAIEALVAKRPFYRIAYHHVLNTPFEDEIRVRGGSRRWFV